LELVSKQKVVMSIEPTLKWRCHPHNPFFHFFSRRGGGSLFVDYLIEPYELTPCTSQSKSMKCGHMQPLCFSFKPSQKEQIWQKELEWENKRGKNSDNE
jgi:hypothetical protein